MMADKDVYGLVVMDRRDGDLAYLKGKTIIPLLNTHSSVPGKFKAGGQSAARFGRARELAAKEFYKRIADYMNEQFLHNEDLKGIIVGGPGPTKYEFVDGNFITGDLKKKIIGIKDLSYTGDFGLQELLERSEDLLAAEDIMKEKKLMQRFFDTLAKNEKKVSYGEAHVRRLISMGMVDSILISENFDENKVVEIEEEATKFGTEMHIISTETREGVQLREIGGIAAMLRYELHE
jgi:peptide chain release factor subunit 1